MVRRRPAFWLFLLTPALLFIVTGPALAQESGGIRGVVSDQEFNVPLATARVTITETGATATTSDDGNYVLSNVPAGKYTLTFTREGYGRQVKSDVAVTAGQMLDLNVALVAETVPMEDLVVTDLQLGGIEEVLGNMRAKNPALTDSISAETIKNSGYTDVAAALKLVSGATVQEGKYAVVRGLPDRYVSSQMNGVRLPTADADKRAVQLDQFPTAIVSSIQVSKTFTPDQQGDASGGAVNVVLKGIPDEDFIQVNTSTTFNTQTTGNNKFLTYKGGGVDFLGFGDGGRKIQPEGVWTGAAGTSRGDAPWNHDFSLSGGGRHEFDTGVKVGGLLTLFNKEDSLFYDNGVDNNLWVLHPGEKMTPQFKQGSPDQGNFKTALYDVTRGVDSVKTGGLATLGLESEHHTLTLSYLYTHAADDVATLAEDTRGKSYYFPGYNVNDPNDPGNQASGAAPYNRNETLQYTLRETQTLQLHGHHVFDPPEFGAEDTFTFLKPELDWTFAHSSSDLNQPDKRQFGEIWSPAVFFGGAPPYLPPEVFPPSHSEYKPAENFTLGNFQRLFKDISEISNQFFVDFKYPFEQWSGDKGYVKAGVFVDLVDRQYHQDTFSNFSEAGSHFLGPFDDFWSGHFPDEGHIISSGPPFVDVDYNGTQDILAGYGMMDLPLTHFFKLIGGARVESTDLSIVNHPERDARWIPPGGTTSIFLAPGAADVSLAQVDVLPSIGFELKAIDKVVFRGSYAETIARPIFKELSPIQQQEYLGGDVFVGNPNLKLSSLQNYDLRVDCTPVEGALLSASYFYKNIQGPIEYVQRSVEYIYTTPVNYPSGTLSGVELEARMQMGKVWAPITGLTLGANATLIDSKVNLPAEEIAEFQAPGIAQSIRSRHMTGAPNFLYNLNATYEWEHKGLDTFGTQFGVFYTVRGDTLKAGAGTSNGGFVPDLYEKEYGTLNLTMAQKIGKYFRVTFQVRNLTNPRIEEVYRSGSIGADAVKTSYTRGIDFAVGVGAVINF